MLVETARLWLSLGHHDRHGVWHLDGVTGPDEYTALVRDNVFTNLMAAHNLQIAADACERHPDRRGALGVTTEEMAAWRDAAGAAHIPYDEDLGVHEQCDGFTTLREWNFTREHRQYPLLLHEPYVRLYPSQVIKQADLVLAMHWRGHAFTPEQKARNLDYYERRTIRDSSLSACTQAVMCAEVGHLELAHDYTYEAALIDLRDLHDNTATACTWPRSPGRGPRWSRGSAACATTRGSSRSIRSCRTASTGCASGCGGETSGSPSTPSHDEVTYTLRDGPDGNADHPSRR